MWVDPVHPIENVRVSRSVPMANVNAVLKECLLVVVDLVLVVDVLLDQAGMVWLEKEQNALCVLKDSK
jgi:hypothetical protein